MNTCIAEPQNLKCPSQCDLMKTQAVKENLVVHISIYQCMDHRWFGSCTLA